ncbi:MAG: GNAT family N-acetyltransferase [Pseudomonadales bacterium]
MKTPEQSGSTGQKVASRIVNALGRSALDCHRLLLWVQGDAASCAGAAQIILRSLPGRDRHNAGRHGADGHKADRPKRETRADSTHFCWVGGMPSKHGDGAGNSAANVKNTLALHTLALNTLALEESSHSPAAPRVEMICSERDAQRLLGSETRAVVFNAHAGFDPNLFAACAGTLAGGGILLLLTPEASAWPTAIIADDYLARMLPGLGAFSAAAPSYSCFIERTATVLGQAASRNELLAVAASDIQAHCFAASQPAHAQTHSAASGCAAAWRQVAGAAESGGSCALQPSAGQRALVAAALELSAVPHGSVLLTAERGRGKTTALGFALQQILTVSAAAPHWPQRALLVAPNRSNIAPLYEVLSALAFPVDDTRLRYCPPDIALLAQHDASEAAGNTLLVIDEAAALALPLLLALRVRYPRQLLATTSGGYEGSGSGFALRFANNFAQSREAGEYRRHIQLEQPMRWACDDPLERITARLLCMQSTAAIAKKSCAKVTTAAKEPGACTASNTIAPVNKVCATIQVESVSARELVQQEALLQETFALLAEAHYQTEPRDLRLLLDAPYTRLWLARRGVEVAGALLAIEEGEIPVDCELVPDILAGRRRPRGNLAAQRLAALTGESQWLHVRSLRVVRIVVAAPLRRRGIATMLHSHVREQLRATHAYLSSSFGFRADLARYWQVQHAAPLHIGMRLDKASGARSLLVAEALSDAMRAPLRRAASALASDLEFLLPRFFPEMSDADKRALRAYCALPAAGDGAVTASAAQQHLQQGHCQQEHDQKKRLARFCAGELGLANVLPTIATALQRDCSVLPAQERQRLAHCVALAPDWAAVAHALDCSGKREIENMIRKSCAVLAGCRG